MPLAHGRVLKLTVIMLVGLGVGLAARPAEAQVREIPDADVRRAEALRTDLRRMIALARDRVFPALVNIRVVTVRYWGGQEQKGRSVGSGTIISDEGHVLTNYHVAQNGKKFTCILADKQEISAVLIGEDPLTDLAVLKLDLDELDDPAEPLPVAEFGDSDKVEIGDTVMAMGSPLALARSVTLGIVSNVERILGSSDDVGELHIGDERTGIFNRWIQHDAAINPGNSGGPLVNLEGEIIGVNTRGNRFGNNLGFAIPSDLAREVAQALIEHGEVPRSWYGISLKPIKDTGYEKGVLVNTVIENSPTAQAGMQAGDVIVAIDGEPLTVTFPEQVPPLLNHLADKPIGSEVHFVVERDGKPHELVVTTERMQRERGDEAAFRAWGITATEITPMLAREMQLDDTEGIVVTSVRSGSTAAVAEPAISSGDVIRRIDGRRITDLQTFIDTYSRIVDMEEPPDYVLIEYDRRGENQITLIKPKPDKLDDPPRELPKAWIGVATQPVISRLARQLGHPDELGFRVTRVYPRTEAATTELHVGDIITAINGHELRPRGMQDAGLFQRVVRRLPIDGTATLTVLRDDKKLDISVPLERTRIEPADAHRDRNEDFGLTVRELTFFDRDERQLDPDVTGVIVVGVESAGWAETGGLQPGDLIMQVNGRDVTGLSGYRKIMEEITAAQPERVVFLVRRGVSTRFQFVEPEWAPAAIERPGADEATSNEPNETQE